MTAVSIHKRTKNPERAAEGTLYLMPHHATQWGSGYISVRTSGNSDYDCYDEFQTREEALLKFDSAGIPVKELDFEADITELIYYGKVKKWRMIDEF